MKTIILLATTLLCFTAMSAQAQISMDNAGTPEAIVGQCPDLPGASVMAACNQYGAVDGPRQEFLEKIEALRERMEKLIQAEQEELAGNLKSLVDKKVQGTSGKSLKQLQSMSSDEREEMANQKANSTLKQMGIKKSVEELGSRELSEAESQKMAGDIAKKMTGFSMSELEALANMSEEEQMMAMLQGDKMKKVQNITGSRGQKATYVNDVESAPAIMEEINKIQEQWKDMISLIDKERDELIETMREIKNKYDAQMPEDIGKATSEYRTKGEENLANRLILARDTECFSIWGDHIRKSQSRLKNCMSDSSRLDKLKAKLGEIGGTNLKEPSSAFELVSKYLDITASFAYLPSYI